VSRRERESGTAMEKFPERKTDRESSGKNIGSRAPRVPSRASTNKQNTPYLQNIHSDFDEVAIESSTIYCPRCEGLG
jgi:hypothetical protein